MAQIVRQATRTEVPLLAGLIRRAFKDVAEDFALTPDSCPSHPAFVSEVNVLEGFVKGGQFWIAEEDEQPCGCVGLVPDRSGVYSLVRLAVLPEYRGRGVGGMLVRQVMQEARSRQLPRVELGIIASQRHLQSLYERHGFRVVDTRRYEHLPFAVTLMTAHLTTA